MRKRGHFAPQTVDGPIHIYGGNKACLALCASQQTTQMSKHVYIIHCWLHEKAKDNELRFSYIASADNSADLFTSALFKPAFEAQRDKLGLKEIELEQTKKEEQES